MKTKQFISKTLTLSALTISISLLASCSRTGSISETTGPLPQAHVQNTYALPAPGNDVVGGLTQTTVETGDTLSQIAQTYQLGYKNILDANPQVNPYSLRTGNRLVMPTSYILPPARYRRGIVINIPALRLYYFSGNDVQIFPVALGREGWSTPIARTYVYSKRENPVWNVPLSIRKDYFAKTGKELPRQMPSGPENPLGFFAVYLHMTGYLIHGTNAPATIGRFISSGCIRMYNQNIEQLFHQMKRGIPVNIIYYPAMAGWHGNSLYLTAYKQAPNEHKKYPLTEVSAKQAIAQATANRPAHINWNIVNKVLRQGRGIPVIIGSSESETAATAPQA